MKFSIKNPNICCPSYTANTMLANLATLGAKASAGMVLTPLSRDIAYLASEELRVDRLAILICLHVKPALGLEHE